MIVGVNNVRLVAAGEYHTCAADGQRRLWCWGLDRWGQLGTGVSVVSARPTAVANVNLIKEIVAGDAHNCARLGDGSVLCWGDGSQGQLGNGSRAIRSVVSPVAAQMGSAMQLAAGGNTTCALDVAGGVSCWGAGEHGQLATADLLSQTRPVAVKLPGPASQVAVGQAHACALVAGAVYCWGQGAEGELGAGPGADLPVPRSVEDIGSASQVVAAGHTTCAVLSDKTVRCWGQGGSGFAAAVTGVSSVKTLFLGAARTCVITTDDKTLCWGGLANPSGQMQEGTAVKEDATLQGALKLALGASHACAVASDGSVSCWGDNSDGRLGDLTFLSRTEARTIGPLPDKAISVAVGATHSCVLLQRGTVYCFGSNDSGQLGNGAQLSEASPVLAPLKCE